MTHWIRSAVRRVMDRSAQTAPATVRGGSSRKKMSGVSTVEYALILVAVVAIVGAAAAILEGDFQTLFTTLGDQITESAQQARDADDIN